MNKNKEQFGIDEIFESGDFSTINNFSSNKLPKIRIAKVYSQLKKKIANKFWTKCIPDEYLMVFLMKYGAKELNEMTF